MGERTKKIAWTPAKVIENAYEAAVASNKTEIF